MNNKWHDAEFDFYLNELLLLQRQYDWYTHVRPDEYECKKYYAKINSMRQKIYKRVTALKNGTGF